MGTVRAIFRYPIKSHGREALGSVVLDAGKTMPWDRHWAVTHEMSKFDEAVPQWLGCANFSVGAKTPTLNAIDAQLNEATGQITLTHPLKDPLIFYPDNDSDKARFMDWITPLMDAARAQPQALVRVEGRGMTDTDFPSISLNSITSHTAVAQASGVKDLSMERWRGNLWFDGFEAWEEFNWIGHRVQIGAAILEVREAIARCNATRANPKTGQIDADTLAILNQHWGHHNYGVYGVVVQGGLIKDSDEIMVLS